MTLSSTGYVIAVARASQWVAGSFAISDLGHAAAAIAAAEHSEAPAIVQITADAGTCGNSLIPGWARDCRTLAEAASVPIALHLVASPTRGLMRQAARIGFTSTRPVGREGRTVRDPAAIRRAAWWAHESELLVEARLEHLTGPAEARSGTCGPRRIRTVSAVASRFLVSTDVDLLSVSARQEGSNADPRGIRDLDFAAITHMAEAIPVPLALHDTEGLPDELLAEAANCRIVRLDVPTPRTERNSQGMSEPPRCDFTRALVTENSPESPSLPSPPTPSRMEQDGVRHLHGRVPAR